MMKNFLFILGFLSFSVLAEDYCVGVRRAGPKSLYYQAILFCNGEDVFHTENAYSRDQVDYHSLHLKAQSLGYKRVYSMPNWRFFYLKNKKAESLKKVCLKEHWEDFPHPWFGGQHKHKYQLDCQDGYTLDFKNHDALKRYLKNSNLKQVVKYNSDEIYSGNLYNWDRITYTLYAE